MAADFDSKRFFFRASDVLKDTLAFVDHEGLLCICALTQRQITPHHVNRKGSRLFGKLEILCTLNSNPLGRQKKVNAKPLSISVLTLRKAFSFFRLDKQAQVQFILAYFDDFGCC